MGPGSVGSGSVGSIPVRESPPGPRDADHHEGQGGSQRRGTRWMMSCDPRLRLSQLRTGCSPMAGGDGKICRTPSHRDKRYTNGSRNTGTLALRRQSITLGHRGEDRLNGLSRPVHVWVSQEWCCRSATTPPSDRAAYCPAGVMVGRAARRVNRPRSEFPVTGSTRRTTPRRVAAGADRHAGVREPGHAGGPMGSAVAGRASLRTTP